MSGSSPIAYLVPLVVWEQICDVLDDLELQSVAKRRCNEVAVPVSLEHL